MLRVGLTGGIGAGKSTVATRLAELGATIIDADVVAREVVEPGTPALAAIADRFGAGVLRPDGALDRSALAAVVFPDPAALGALEAITDPAIAQRVSELRSATDPRTVTVYDMPLLVERRLWPREHLTVVVGADEEVRVRRLVEQRGLDKADVQHRIARQATDDERRAAADVWVDNNGAPGETREQVDRLWAGRLLPYNANLLARAAALPPRTPLPAADGSWPQQAVRLASRIADALGDRAIAVSHVGPTSVPDLAAPDVIEIQVAVRDLSPAGLSQALADLADRGFVPIEDDARPADTGHAPDLAVLQSADPGRPARVYVCEFASPAWEFVVKTRDWLRADPAAREAYASAQRRALDLTDATAALLEAGRKWCVDAYPHAVDWAERTGWQPRGDELREP